MKNRAKYWFEMITIAITTALLSLAFLVLYLLTVTLVSCVWLCQQGTYKTERKLFLNGEQSATTSCVSWALFNKGDISALWRPS